MCAIRRAGHGGAVTIGIVLQNIVGSARTAENFCICRVTVHNPSCGEENIGRTTESSMYLWCLIAFVGCFERARKSRAYLFLREMHNA